MDFVNEHQPDPALSLPNGRDVADIVGANLATDRLIRSGVPSSGANMRALRELRVGYVVDLRTPQERQFRPCLPPASSRYLSRDVLSDEVTTDAVTMSGLAKMMGSDSGHKAADPSEIRSAFIAGYQNFVRLPSAHRATGDVLRLLAAPDPDPVLIHCTAGKDRTGWIVAVALLLADVERDRVFADYALSTTGVKAMFAPYREQLVASGLDPTGMDFALTADPDYLQAALDLVESQSGDITGFALQELGLTPGDIDRIGSNLTSN